MKHTKQGRFPDVGSIIEMRTLLPALLIIVAFQGCSRSASSPDGGSEQPRQTEEFKSYWYSGKAEVNSYRLSQSRYGEDREGKAVLIFVAEDFSRKKQVKLDDPASAPSDKLGVLKMNFTKNFVTGIYPYSMMLSVFSPIEQAPSSHAVKTTMSSQEWCGHVFSQINLRGDKYSFVGHSYFEQEGEERFSLKSNLLEDELWNLIRLNPENLPLGNVKLIPGLFFTRLKHSDLKSLNAILSKSESGEVVSYSVSIPDQERNLTIHYQKQFPHKILGWEEAFDERGQKRETKAVLDKTLLIDYWRKNKNEFQYLRDSLGLSLINY